MVWKFSDATRCVDMRKIFKNLYTLRRACRIAQKTSLTDKAKKIFYQADPEFIGSDIFATYCLGETEQSSLWHAREQYSTIKRVLNREYFSFVLKNLSLPTAGFPLQLMRYFILLSKLSTEERERIGNPSIRNLPVVRTIHISEGLRHYQNVRRRRERGARNEIHSIFGVEYRDISSELESITHSIFDRKALVLLYENAGFENAYEK